MYLKGPWRYQPLAAVGDSPLPPAGTARLPASWQELFGEFRGTVRFTRNFHQPTNLEPHERVWIVVEGVGGAASVVVNGEPLGDVEETSEGGEFDVTFRIQEYNELQVDVCFETQGRERPGGLWAPVAVEVREEPPA